VDSGQNNVGNTLYRAGIFAYSAMLKNVTIARNKVLDTNAAAKTGMYGLVIAPVGASTAVAVRDNAFRVTGPTRYVHSITTSTTTGEWAGFTVGAGITVTPETIAWKGYDLTYNHGSATTVAAPTTDLLGATLSLRIRNTSGGAMGTITWDAAYKMAAWTNPANGTNRSIEFRCIGTGAWVEVNRTPADVPN
jgi:hypothetical protein